MFCFTFLLYVIILFILIIILKFYFYLQKTIWKKKYPNRISVGFFHPYCNAGGGGERVLWAAVRAVQKKYKDAHCVIYTGDNVTDEDIIRNVKVRFNIILSGEVDIIHLKARSFVEAKHYPYFTLLLQSMGSVILGLEALFRHVPDILLDTMGYAFTFPAFKFIGSCRIGAYVHFPTISTDMLKVVEARTIAVNNRRFISNSKVFSQLKLIYYKLFACLYGRMGRLADVIMVNSSWTKGHILELWAKPECTFTVYPPCDVSEFNNIPLERHADQRTKRIISIAQFRPEKNHSLQIKSFHEFLNRSDTLPNQPQLILIGSCRHEEDYERVENLKKLCNDLGITANVEFKLNLTFQEIIQEMTNSSVALHTMLNEHFGISVVECMSAGLITIAHNSGGPKMDIITDTDDKRTGFLSNDIESYASSLEKVFKMNYKELYQISKTARESVSRFSDQNFESEFLTAVKFVFL